MGNVFLKVLISWEYFTGHFFFFFLVGNISIDVPIGEEYFTGCSDWRGMFYWRLLLARNSSCWDVLKGKGNVLITTKYFPGGFDT